MSEGLVATGKGIALVGLTVAAAALWAVLSVALAFSVLGFGLLLIPPPLLAMRRLANVYRRVSTVWCGVTIAVRTAPIGMGGTNPVAIPGKHKRAGGGARCGSVAACCPTRLLGATCCGCCWILASAGC